MSTHFDSMIIEENSEFTDFFNTLPPLWYTLTKSCVSQGDDQKGPCVVAFSTKNDTTHIESTSVPTDKLQLALDQMHHCESSVAQVKEAIIDQRLFYLVPLASSHETYSIERQSRKWGLTLAAHLPEMITQMNTLSFAACDRLSFPHVCDGLIQGLYKSTGYKSKSQSKAVIFKSWYFPQSAFDPNLSFTLNQAIQLSRAKIITRHLGDTPANLLTPMEFAKVAVKLGDVFGFKVKTYDHHALKEHKMNSMLSVAQGSANPPRMIVCEIEGSSEQAQDKPVVFIGKGVTFDSGGISLKPPGSMYEMKYDMLGGATVMGAVCYLASQAKKHPVVALIGCVENMPAHHASRPGDVVQSMGGETIEILNTDAEGRLVMADLFGYAQKYHYPQLMVDVATLTGACLYALGSVGAALMSPHQKFAELILSGAQQVGEPLWQLPLWPDLKKCMTSTVADVKNITSPHVKAGTITAGIFLSHFVHEDVPWAHFDIAGSGYHSQAFGYPSKGASGYGVETLSWIAQNAHLL